MACELSALRSRLSCDPPLVLVGKHRQGATSCFASRVRTAPSCREPDAEPWELRFCRRLRVGDVVQRHDAGGTRVAWAGSAGSGSAWTLTPCPTANSTWPRYCIASSFRSSASSPSSDSNSSDGRRRKTEEPSGDSTVSSGWNSQASSWFRSRGSCPFTRNRVMTQSPSSSRRARPST